MSRERGTAVDTSAATDVEPDPVDRVRQRFPVTDRPTWLILAGIALLVVAGFGWAVFGRAPDSVTGRGMVVPAEGFVEVGTELQGTVVSVAVTPGAAITSGAEVARIRDSEGSVVVVTSPVSGRVATVLVRKGGVTDRGTALATIEPDDAELVVVGFLPAGPGKRVAEGMPVRVALDSVPRSEFGMIWGRVVGVSPVPVSPERIVLDVGGNVTLADYFLAQGPVLEVTVHLDEDPSTPSGYRWTTGTGPDIDVSPGTLAEVSVVITEAAPISRIIP